MNDQPHHPFDYDVAVIGAGPMGSFAAERMARAGLRVGLFEKDVTPGDSTVCAGGMHRDLIQYLNLPEELVERGLHVFRVTIRERVSQWHFDLPTYITIERQKLDQYLSSRAVNAGAQLITQARVVDVAPDQEMLTYLWGADKKHCQARAKVFVFADGPHSLARRLLVPPEQRRKDPEYVGIEYDLEAKGNAHDALEIIPDAETLPFGYYWVFPKKDHINVGLARMSLVEGPGLTLLLNRFIESRADLCGRPLLQRKGGTIPAKLGPVLQKGNCLVVGDAAGMINPLTGGGYVCGFVSAALAADTCIRAFQNNGFNERHLEQYAKRLRRTKHYMVMRMTHPLLTWMVHVYASRGKPLYLPLLKTYFYAVHVAMRYVSVL